MVGFTRVHDIGLYIEPASYDHTLNGTLFILSDEFQYEDSLGVKSYNSLIQMLLPLCGQLRSLALSSDFWAIDPDDPLDSQLQLSVDFDLFERLKHLRVPVVVVVAGQLNLSPFSVSS